MTDRSSIVWIIQNTRRRVDGQLKVVHDTRAAERFGTRRSLISEKVKPWNPGAAIPQLRKRLADFRPDRDHLLLIGSPLFCSLAFAMVLDKAAHEGCQQVSLLHWNKIAREYEQITVRVTDVVDIEWDTP